MKRDLPLLANTTYDLLVIGGGIHGACIAWDAAQRGLSVALIERADFASATSANSLKTVHGGLRYLQDADIVLVRKMIGERKALLRIAPHLVHPLPVVMPTYRSLTKSGAAMLAALMLNDAFGFDRNRGQDRQKQLPHGRVISREACLRLLPGIADAGITGAAVWYDGQVYNTERLLLAFIASAVACGAAAANYVEASELLVRGGRVVGVRAHDHIGGRPFTIQARLVVNATGAWIDRLLGTLNMPRPAGRADRPSVAWNLVTRKFIDQVAAGIVGHSTGPDGRPRSRMLFVAPWRDCSLIGTVHEPYAGDLEGYRVSEEQIAAFLAEVNRAYPGARLTRRDVRLVHEGFLPARSSSPARVKLLREGVIFDHSSDYRLDGLISVLGVKYTSARGVAAKAVDLAAKKLGIAPRPSQTATTRLHGGQIEQFHTFLERQLASRPAPLAEPTMRQLAYNYGTEAASLLRSIAAEPALGEPLGPETAVIKAEVLHAVRSEMACHLADVVFRRTELGSAGHPGPAALRACADIMAGELGWAHDRVVRELAEVEGSL